MKYQDALNIEELRRIARRRLPRVVLDFVEGGAEDQVTLRANRMMFESLRFRPRTLVDVSGRSQKTSLFGREITSPIGIAPTGLAGICCFHADIALAKAAAQVGVPFVMSTSSTMALEKVTQAAGGRLWFQLYLSNDREAGHALVQRALNAGYEALIVSADVAAFGNREYNVRNGFEVPFRLRGWNVIDGLLHPRWLFGVLGKTLIKSGVPRFESADSKARGGRITSQRHASRDALKWEDIRWLRRLWHGTLIIKGVRNVDDVLLALEHGVDGVILSNHNHGGRQHDGALSPIEVLPEVVAKGDTRMTVMADSGVRRGSDVVKLGARSQGRIRRSCCVVRGRGWRRGRCEARFDDPAR